MRLAARISYDGTAYAGWQRQQNAITVQEVIEEKLSVLWQNPISIVGCGRTDTGVHAKGYVLHFDVDQDPDFNLKHALYRINQLLPCDISFMTLKKVDKKFHARFDALQRSYSYHLHTVKNPFSNLYSTYYPQAKKIDVGLLHETAEVLRKYNDFNTFCKTDSDVKTTICKIEDCYWTISDDNSVLTFDISADRFLRGMIRLIVGTSINVALGKLSIDSFEHHIMAGSKPPHIFSAPPQGLFLRDIRYGDDV